MWKTAQLTDRAQILSYLEADRLYAAYAIGDLEPWMFEQCTWAGAETKDGRRALVLCFRGLQPPPLFMMGSPDGLRAILSETLCPERAYLNCLKEHLPVTHEFYHWQETTPMWRLALCRDRFRPAGNTCIRLEPTHAGPLSALYALGGGGAFHPSQIELGVFYGILVDGQLVAVAGTHLVSPTYGVAAVGNVFTHPAHRGRGYGSAATSAVAAELLRRGITDIVLNVSQSNVPAIRIYERLGFERYCAFLEGPARAR